MTNGEKLIRDFPYIEIKGQDEVFTAIQIDTTGTGTPIIVYTEWWNAEYKEPTTKNALGVDCISREDARKTIIDHQYSDSFCVEHNIDHSINTGMALIALSDLPSVTPQEPKTGYISIDDAMSVFDDFMCGEVDEEGTETFLEMLKDKAESEAEDGNDES